MKVTKKTLLVSLAIAIPVMLGGGYLLAKKVVWPRYKSYRAASFERSARDYLEKGDFENAMLFVRKNLAADQRSIANWRLAAEISEKRADPNTLFYLQRLLALEPSLENRLRVIRLSLQQRGNRTAEAEAAIAGAGTEARDSAEFHELAVQTYLRSGNTIQAKFHLITLCGLQPDNRQAQLELAQLRLADAGADLRGSIRSEVRSLSSDPALRTSALALLLNDSITHEESHEALELAAQLQREATLPVSQAIVVANALRRFAPDAFPAYAETLRTLAGERPADIARVGLFLIGADRAAETKAWLATLPPSATENLLVQRINAAAQADLREWAPLETFLKQASWQDYEFERLALLAYAQRQLGHAEAFGETWRLALTNAGTTTAKLEILQQRTALWGWSEQRFEVLWRLFQLNPRQTSIQQQLYAHERASGNTANLNRLFARLLEVAPDDASAKNNYAYTCLLLGTNTARADTLSREALASDPANPYFATTRALALLRSGDSAQARAVLNAVSSLQLWQPERVIVHAAVLTADRAFDEASLLLSTVTDRGLLPEEQQLLADSLAAIARHRSETARTAQISETVAAHRDATAAKSILALLPPALSDRPSLQMELADSLYARDQFAALAKELKSTPWERHEFLRLALLAYAQRRLERPTDARDTWRLAVNTAGTRSDLQRVLATLAATWGWTEERIDLLGRILQREPGDHAALDEVVTYYTRQRSTNDLARTYGTIVAAGEASASMRARFAYYNLLIGSNTSEAHVAAKTAFDQTPTDAFAARALALSLWKQGQSRAGLQIFAGFAARIDPEVDLSLVLALLHEAAGEPDKARQLIAGFAVAAALPEEQALAEDLSKKLSAAE